MSADPLDGGGQSDNSATARDECDSVVVFVQVAILTRATPRRIAGAFAGGGVFAVLAIGIIAIGEGMRWWHMSIRWEPVFLLLLWLGVSWAGRTLESHREPKERESRRSMICEWK